MYVYFDIGGTKTRVATSHDQKEFTEPVKFDTPHKLDALYTAIHDHARTLGGNEPIVAAGGGVACPVDRDNHSKLCWAPNLPETWFEHSLVDELGSVLECPVYIDNDTVVIGMGEMEHGAGQGHNIIAYITISTGVGGARVVRGQYEAIGISAEPGWQFIDFDKTVCTNCKSGNAQILLSGSAMEKRYGKKPYEVTDPAVWEQMAEWTAYMLNNTIVHWSPDAIVLGGSMVIGDPAIPVSSVRKYLEPILTYPKMPVIEEAKLGDFGGIYGAMEFVKQRLASQ